MVQEGEKQMTEDEALAYALAQLREICPHCSDDRIIEVIRRNSQRGPLSVTDSFLAKVFEDLSSPEQADSASNFIGPAMKPGTSSQTSEIMDIVPYYDPKMPSISEETVQTSISRSHVQPSTSQAAYNTERNEEEMIRDPNKTVGLFNQGNTCWFNSLTQMLFSIPKFRSVLYNCTPLTWHEQPIKNVQVQFELHADLLIRFRRLFVELYFSEESHVVAGEILTIVDRLYTAKGGPSTIGSQQDASEMLTLIMQWLGYSINAAIYAHLHPNFTRVIDEENNMVISHSSEQAPNSDVAGTLPPVYQENVQDLASSTSVKREAESRANSPVKNVPARDSFGGPAAKSPRTSPSDLPQIEEAMDTSEGPDTQARPKAESVENPRAPEAMEDKAVDARTIELVEKIKHDYAQIFQATSHMEKFSDSGELVGDVNTNMHCPVCFNLPVSYGNLHDALEASTFEVRADGDKTVNTRSMYEALPAVFFVSLNRFHFGKSGAKLHDKFTFPREIFMDRYIRKNADLITPLRAKLADLRNKLSEARARLNGLHHYPHGTMNLNVINLIDAFQSVLNATTNSRTSEDPSPFRPPNNYGNSLNFIKDQGKIFPVFEESFPDLHAMNRGLKDALSELKSTEAALLELMARLEQEIQGIYEVEELKKENYELKAMILHVGEINRGHYWMYKLKRSIDGFEEWEKLNDQSATPVDYSQIEKEAFGTGISTDPSAYLLLYVKKDAHWLMEPDTETHQESFERLPSDLQEYVTEKKEAFRKRLQEYRERQSALLENPQPTSEEARGTTQFSWYRSEDHMQEDENANIDPNEILGRRLDSYAIPEASSEEMQEMRNVTQGLWTMIVNFDRDSFSSPIDLLDSNLRMTMDKAGSEFIEKNLGYSVKELRGDAENDTERIYNHFIMTFIRHMELKDIYSHFSVFVAAQLQRVYIPVIRYLLVRSMAISNLGVLKIRAQGELEGHCANSSDNGKSMETIVLTLSHMYQLGRLIATHCRISMEKIVAFQNGDSIYATAAREKENLENVYCALVAAKHARMCYKFLRIRADFLGKDTIYFVNQAQIDACTVFAVLGAIKIITNLFNSTNDKLDSLATYMTSCEASLNPDIFVNEICCALSQLQLWGQNLDRDAWFSNEIDIVALNQALISKIEVAGSGEKVDRSEQKRTCAHVFHSALTESTNQWVDSISRGPKVIVLDGAEELRLIQELSEKFCGTSATQGKVDGMLLAIDENIGKLFTNF
ncbi:hypothetical protein L5515_013392 [Caenorhabditis briggsae]|uniref:ubiquitinyl hydrolase 1 n=3 Tax=Caenorhabditis briggsae TaxID=6238 RepID=A0AAE9E693_CAEBR|nr:hypothetical protein L5515_013392 [Caenorhabditis briggsae]